MDALRNNRRVAVLFLCALFFTLALVGAARLNWLSDHEGLRSRTLLMQDQAYRLLETLPLKYYLDSYPESALESGETDARETLIWNLNSAASDFYDPNVFFTLRDEAGKLLAGSERLGDYRAKESVRATLPRVATIDKTCSTHEEWLEAAEKLLLQYDQVRLSNRALSEEEDYETPVEEITTENGYRHYLLRASCWQREEGDEMAAGVEPPLEGPVLVDIYSESWADYQAQLRDLEETYERVEYCGDSREGYPLVGRCLDMEGGETVTLSVFLRNELEPYGEVYDTLSRAAWLYDLRPVYLAFAVLGAVLGLACLAWLLREAYRVTALTRLDRKLPVDLVIPGGLILLLAWLVWSLSCHSGRYLNPDLFPWRSFPFQVLLLVAVLWCVCSLLRRRRVKEPRKEVLLLTRLGRLCRRLGTQLGRGVRWLKRLLRRGLDRLPLVWRSLVILLGFAFLEGLSIIAIHDGEYGGVFLWFLLKGLQTLLLLRVVLGLRQLQAGGYALAEGDLDYQVPLDRLRGDLRAHGENLNAIRAAIQTAVEKQMKSERMRTELITNVSHDIKTPLTSIISYVDLLKKEEMPSQEARDYLAVLDRQSARLKKLTEDLIEASKASTGNLTVDFQPTDVNVLLSQSAGEYEARLAARDLRLVLDPDPAGPAISADGRLLWRVFDNLLSNVCKYAQPGTRVYLSSRASESEVTILFRNISAGALNITPEELMERFVRGDEARSSEGSGLGLAIAQDLTRLQRGRMALDIDGDLFKVALTFPRLG